MDRPRDQFLAGPVLSRDQHAPLRWCSLRDQRSQTSHRRRRAHELSKLLDIVLEGSRSILHANEADRVGHREHDALVPKWFLHEIQRAFADRPYRQIDGAGARHDHHGLRMPTFPHGSKRLEAAATGHVDVHQDRVVGLGGELIEGVFARAGHRNVIFRPAEHSRNECEQPLVVVDDENRRYISGR